MAISRRWLYLDSQCLTKKTDLSVFRAAVATEKRGSFKLPSAAPAETETITPVSEARRHPCFS